MVIIRYFYNFHDILKIRSNIDLRFNYFRVNSCDYDFDLFLVKDFKIKSNSLKKLGMNYFGEENNEKIYFRDKIFSLTREAMLKDLSGKTKLYINKAYYLTKLPTDLYNFLDRALQIKFLTKGFTLLHSACISHKNEGILITAFADTGKTLSVLQLLKYNSFDYLSDDLIIIDKEGNAYCLPRLVNYRSLKKAEYLNGKSNYKFYLGGLRTKIAELPYLAAYIGTIDAKDIYKTINIKIKRKIKVMKVFFLENDKNECKKIDRDTAFKKIYLINRVEFGDFPPLILKYFYLNSKLNLNNFVKIEKNLIKNVIYNSDCYQICNNNPKMFSKMIYNVLTQ